MSRFSPSSARLRATICAVVLMALPLTAQAETGTPITPLKRLEVSRLMYRAGLADQDPLMIVAAAKMRKTAPMVAGTRTPMGGTAATTGPLSAEAMLNTAALLAQGDPAMEKLVEDVRFVTVKGVQNGPVYSSTAIAAQKTDKYPGIAFAGGSYAEIYVEGHGASDLDLHVYDSAGRLVCSDTDITDIAYCGWRPDKADQYTIQVINKGKGTEYSLVTN
jgi:hypothetical protein